MGNGEMKLNRYPKYKPTGIAWLPEVPEGWEVKRVATLLKIKDCPSAPNEELLSVFLDRGVIRFSEGGEKRANATSKDLSRYQLVEVDDFVDFYLATPKSVVLKDYKYSDYAPKFEVAV